MADAAMCPKCRRVWNVVHAVYSGKPGVNFIRRWCSECGVEQVGEVTRWRLPRKDEFDQTAEEAAEEISRPLAQEARDG